MPADQFRILLRHLQVLIAIIGFQAGLAAMLAWQYLP
jgi:hypothetical protein